MSAVSLEGHIVIIVAPEHIDGKTALELNEGAIDLQRQERPDQATDWLTDLSRTKSFSLEARQALKGREELIEVRRHAIVVSSTFVRTIVKFILHAGGLEDRAGFFANREEALAWLNHLHQEE